MICPEGLAASVTAVAAALSQGRSADELGLLGALFTQLGDTLTTISLAKSINENQIKSKNQDGQNKAPPENG